MQIAHIDADAFFASAEILRHPEFRDTPLIIAGLGHRSVVATANYKARAFGVHAAMSSNRAAHLCPDAKWLPPDHAYYRELSKSMMKIIHDKVLLVETLGLDEAYLDISSVDEAEKFMEAISKEILAFTGLRVSIGIGDNKLLAKIASNAAKPQGLLSLDQETASEKFKDSSPKLLPGIGPKTLTRLEKNGFITIQDLAEAPLSKLQEIFGKRLGLFLQERGRFQDDSRVLADRVRKSHSNETTFSEDISDPDALRDNISSLCVELDKTLRNLNCYGKTISIKVRFNDWETSTRAKTFQDPVREVSLINEAAWQLLEEFVNKKPIRLLGVKVSNFEKEPAYLSENDFQQLTLPI